jgi:hypothetical protein
MVNSGGGGGRVTALLFVCLSTLACVGAIDAARCHTLGFAESLMCSGCTKLKTALSKSAHADAANELVNECESCCTADAVAKPASYAEASLVICN